MRCKKKEANTMTQPQPPSGAMICGSECMLPMLQSAISSLCVLLPSSFLHLFDTFSAMTKFFCYVLSSLLLDEWLRLRVWLHSPIVETKFSATFINTLDVSITQPVSSLQLGPCMQARKCASRDPSVSNNKQLSSVRVQGHSLVLNMNQMANDVKKNDW